MDYKNLEYFMKAQNLNRKQAHQALYLSRFDFILKHVLETKMKNMDRLSRQPDQKISVEKNNEDQALIKDHQIHNLSKVVIEGPEVDIVVKIKIARRKNEEVIRVIEKMKKAGVKEL